MAELATGAIKFLVRSGTTPLPGASVYTSVNGYTWYYRGYTDGVGLLMVLGLPAGLNYYMVGKTGYSTVNGSVNVPANSGIQVDIYLTRTLSVMSVDMMGSLTITSNPEGAQVYINGDIQEALTPVTITDLPEGDYILELVKDGYGSTTVVRVARRQNVMTTASLSYIL